MAVSTSKGHGQSSNGCCSSILLMSGGGVSVLGETSEVWTDRDGFSHEKIMFNGLLLANTE